MLCLSCGHDNQGPGPTCAQCGFSIGYLAESRGFMPQLHALKTAQQEGRISPDAVQESLQRLDQALAAMLLHVDQTGAALASLGLDETQAGVLGGFLAPMREALESFWETARTLEGGQEIPAEALEQLDALQISISQGSEGVAYLTQTLHSLLLAKVAAGEQLSPLPSE